MVLLRRRKALWPCRHPATQARAPGLDTRITLTGRGCADNPRSRRREILASKCGGREDLAAHAPALRQGRHGRRTDGAGLVVQEADAHRHAVGRLVAGHFEAHPRRRRQAVQIEGHVGVDIAQALVAGVGQGAGEVAGHGDPGEGRQGDRRPPARAPRSSRCAWGRRFRTRRRCCACSTCRAWDCDRAPAAGCRQGRARSTAAGSRRCPRDSPCAAGSGRWPGPC